MSDFGWILDPICEVSVRTQYFLTYVWVHRNPFLHMSEYIVQNCFPMSADWRWNETSKQIACVFFSFWVNTVFSKLEISSPFFLSQTWCRLEIKSAVENLSKTKLDRQSLITSEMMLWAQLQVFCVQRGQRNKTTMISGSGIDQVISEYWHKMTWHTVVFVVVRMDRNNSGQD